MDSKILYKRNLVDEAIRLRQRVYVMLLVAYVEQMICIVHMEIGPFPCSICGVCARINENLNCLDACCFFFSLTSSQLTSTQHGNNVNVSGGKAHIHTYILFGFFPPSKTMETVRCINGLYSLHYLH